MIRHLASLIAASVLLVSSLSSRAAGGELSDIAAVFERKLSSLQTIRIDTTETTEPELPDEVLFRDVRILPQFPIEAVLICHRDGRLFSSVADPWIGLDAAFYDAVAAEYPQTDGDLDKLFELPYNRVRAIANAQRVNDEKVYSQVKVFDGMRLWEYKPEERALSAGVARRAFIIVSPDRAHQFFFRQSILDGSLVVFDVPNLNGLTEYRRTNRLGEMLRHGAYAITGQEDAGGATCTVVECPGKERIFFDPKIGFAVRKRQRFADGQIISEFVANQFQTVTPELWLPRRASYVEFGPRGSKYFGKAMYRQDIQVTRIEIDDPRHLDYFSVEVPAGSWVNDQTIRPSPEVGQRLPPRVIPAVTYIQPADDRDVEKAIRMAQLGLPAQEIKRWGARDFVRVAGICAAVTIAILLVGASLVRRRTPTAGPDGAR